MYALLGIVTYGAYLLEGEMIGVWPQFAPFYQTKQRLTSTYYELDYTGLRIVTVRFFGVPPLPSG